MDSQSTQTIKLPILQPENGNAPIVTKKIVDGKETVIPPTSVEEKAQRRAELKARSTLLLRTDLRLAFLSLAALTMQQSINTTQGVNTVRNSGSADTPNFKKFLKKTGRKLYWPKKKRLEVLTSQRWIISTATREDTLQRPQESRQQNKEPIRRTVPVEETTSNALLSQCDGFGYDIGVTQQKRSNQFCSH
ncbi:hypothetical protein Tco_0821835 [Tanacetum coccineum]|uniref:Uncharacterized protein n=1 Tax=Tanacetum coccineum TaxID=301880 RepID=A0ABQ5ADC3_9ASTR